MALKFSIDGFLRKLLSNILHLTILYDRKNNNENVGRGSP